MDSLVQFSNSIQETLPKIKTKDLGKLPDTTKRIRSNSLPQINIKSLFNQSIYPDKPVYNNNLYLYEYV